MNSKTPQSPRPVLATVWCCKENQPEEVSTVDLPFETVAAAYRVLCRIPQDVLALRLDLSGSFSAEDLARLFQLNMYNMTELYLGAEPLPDDFGDTIGSYTTQQWPMEDTLIMSIDLEDGFCSYVAPPFVYADFLHGLNLWVALERIDIRTFLHIPTLDTGHIPAAELDSCNQVLAKHANLETLIVEDVPHRVQFLLGYLYIPTNVDVHLVATSTTRPFEIAMVEEMLPSHPVGAKGVRMLDEATRVHVEVGRNNILVCGKLSTDKDDKRRIVLEARPVSASARIDSHNVRGGFLYGILHKLSQFFDPRGVTHLRIDGDVTWIDVKDDWVDFLQPFRNLESLEVADHSWGRYGQVSAMCEALASTYDAWLRLADPICPRLKELHIADVEFSESGLYSLYEALKSRKSRGHAITHCLYKLRARGGVTPLTLQRAVNKLSSVVSEEAVLENQIPDPTKTYRYCQLVVRLLPPAGS
ncbi:hypothetical protein L226DRAFT_607377 [Lentinus tigrinus ALCF2SS1-7]|uniref:uncharacterized protein n=1 Tax=Lentinus tigrinus ALCF2SS1-7 TaxID=1328758 RepID=UPI001165DB43|nr:hypothetical protein L226DRAFT_607377 [Lentinus tigrinus ALCF2SS1-7]